MAPDRKPSAGTSAGSTEPSAGTGPPSAGAGADSDRDAAPRADAAPTHDRTQAPPPIGILAGLKGLLVWIGGALAGLTAILYVCGYLITTAHIYTLGLYGLVDFGKDYFLLEGAKFVLAVVIGLAQALIRPTLILLVAVLLVPITIAAIFVRNPLDRYRHFLDQHRVLSRWLTVMRVAVYGVLLIACAAIAYESLLAISWHLQIADLLYSLPPDDCQATALQIRDAFLCGHSAVLRAAFDDQLWSALQLIGLSYLAWLVVARWRWRAWLIGPLLFVTVLVTLLLPMEFGVLLKPTRYPLVRIELDPQRPAARYRFLIDRSEQALTVWDPRTRRVLWIPAGDVVRMETVAVAELFEPVPKPRRLP